MTGQCFLCGGWHTNPHACPAQLGNSGASFPLTDWAKHYEVLFQRASHERDWYKGMLFDAWRTIRGQSKGLQRQRRLIKRLQKQVAGLQSAVDSRDKALGFTEITADNSAEANE